MIKKMKVNVYHNRNFLSPWGGKAAFARGHRVAAFTMAELVVVIGIITVLMAMVVVVARGVVRDEKVRLTRSVITALEAAIEGFEDKSGTSVPDTLDDLIKNFDPDMVKYLPDVDTTDLPGENEYLNIEALAYALTSRDFGGSFIELDRKRLVNKNKNYYDADNNNEFQESEGDIELFEIVDAWGEPFYFENPGGKGGPRHSANLNEIRPDIWSAGPDGTNLCLYFDDPDDPDGKYDEAGDRGAKAQELSEPGEEHVPSDDIVNWE